MFAQPGTNGASQIDFAAHYDHLCATRGMAPIPAVKLFLSQGVLDINGDRIKYAIVLKRFYNIILFEHELKREIVLYIQHVNFIIILFSFLNSLLRYPEWEPIFGAIKNNKTLAWIAIRSYYYPPEEFGTTQYFYSIYLFSMHWL